MSRPSRRQVHQPTPQYAVVPTSPSRANSHSSYQQQPAPQPHTPYVGGPRPVRSSSAHSRSRSNSRQQNGRNAIAMGVATGNIGAGYGPYSYQPEQARDTGMYTNTRFSTTPSETSVVTAPPPMREKVAPAAPMTTTVPQYMWDKDPDLDDALHNPDPRRDFNFTPFSLRGWLNVGMIFILIAGLLMLFIGYPVLLTVRNQPEKLTGFNKGGINSTGQIPEFINFPRLIDDDTPESVMTRTGSDGKLYDLVFSDEFNTDGRTFYPGDDPFWEAADLHYWPTGDVEWYDPSAVTTQNGKLVLTMTEKRSHDLNFESGMLTSWNKLCFNTGYIEVSVSMPGSPEIPGLWPGAWTLGNLGRAGYGASTQGTWPYSYDSCDLGTFPFQQARDGTPVAASTGGNGGQPLSAQPGQKLSACSCPGSDHPGPRYDVGRGVPEIDIIETQIDVNLGLGEVSQSFQCAPYDMGYDYVMTTPATTVYNDTISKINTYQGGPYQQAVSAVTLIESQFYGGNGYAPYGFEFWSDPNNRDDGYITWYSNGQETWKVTSATVGPNAESQVSQRLIPEEPMYVIMNLGQAPSFQKADYKHLTFPVSMYIDYVRIYQRRGLKNGITCDPPNRPTSDYITKHMNAYTNANLTTWANASYSFPRNRLYDGC